MEHTQQRVIHASTVSASSDEQAVISAAQRGDKHAFKALYHGHVGRVYALCFRLTGDKG